MLETLFLAAVLFLAINAVSARARVEGYSMLPTLNNDQYVLVDRLPSYFGGYRRGDIIVFRPPMYPQASLVSRLFGFPLPGEAEDYIKRIIGLPGDHVVIGGGVVSVNGTALLEPYIQAEPTYSGTWKVPANSLFVLGDNRNNSSDSHSWGFLPIKNVLGKAVLVYFPFSASKILADGQSVQAAP
jgi:signal peptidase I